ncbi:MAG: diaminopimelate decarboxylase family protein [Candidatus Limnocylindrales bacterium]
MTAPAAIEVAAPTDLATLAETFGTPLYVYDLAVIERQVAALVAALPPAFELAYAVKANPALAVVSFLGSLGLGADVASGGELETARRARIGPSRIVVTGPGKRTDELRAAVEASVRAITVESPGELERLERLAAESGRRVPVLLRAAVPSAAQLERLRIVGDAGAGKFGMGLADLRVAAVAAARSPHLEPLGIHAFGASNVLDAAALADHAAWVVDLGRTMAAEAGFRLRLVDVGGGLGIPYRPDERALDLDELARRLASLTERVAADPATRGLRILVEPGRYLVGPAGTYVARIVDTKAVDGSTVAILDGGINHLLRPVLVGQEHRIRLLPRTGERLTDRAAGAAEPTRVTIAGPLCSGLDVLAASTVMAAPRPDDLVAVLDVGAYGFTESMPLFLSHPMPAEVAIRDGRAALIRPRIEPVEWLDRQIVPWATTDEPSAIRSSRGVAMAR